MVFHKHYLKSYVAEFVFSEIDKMLASSYFFIVNYKTQRNKKNYKINYSNPTLKTFNNACSNSSMVDKKHYSYKQ